LLETIDWLEPEILEATRKWRGVAETETFLKWSNVKDQLAQSGVKGIFGKFNGESGQIDALTARKALLLFASLESRPAAVLLLRDSDGDPRRQEGQGLKQARETNNWPFSIVVGVAHPKREAWVLAGFDPQSHEESERLRKLRERLSVDPILKSHELGAREHGAKTDIKRAMNELILDNGDRERQCLHETALEALEQRGKFNGLAAYLDEVRQRLVPIFSGRAPVP
jgi:hypothetical protein